ncbi:uncharacterized protein LOC108605440 [Drosophila busckii]|uniref:uncharacterized protein LOC108605440 n=1 Tax=Drosophila busckii TaxID=30019 RepID=UPI00083ED001|nr:uncharacterized protein LOC108605440 [Drosophila busckii]
MAINVHQQQGEQQFIRENLQQCKRQLKEKSLRTMALRFQSLIMLATAQIQCYEHILDEAKKITEKFKALLRNHKMNAIYSKLQRDSNKLLQQLNFLKVEMAKTNEALNLLKLQLHKEQEKFFNRHASIKISIERMKTMQSDRLLQQCGFSFTSYASGFFMFFYDIFYLAEQLLNTRASTKPTANNFTCEMQLAAPIRSRSLSSFYFPYYLRALWLCISSWNCVPSRWAKEPNVSIFWC